ncbi:melatonin receptor type 1A-like [Acropora muricata]|uniref:melatonin receptor type 1A-like n=1 Tax=Acropora millepora TaxID=45264 RepID=UPI001CF5A1C5|nr:melatonin receptor type 1A-like [Acropora millepora]
MPQNSFDDLSVQLRNRGLSWITCETASYLLIALLAVIGNSFVLLAIYRNPQLRTVPNYFIAALAMSDIFLPLLSGPQSITVALLGSWPFSENACQAQAYFIIVLTCASMQILTLTAINRFYRIVRTKNYNRIFTKRNTIIMILLSSFLASVEPLPYLLSGRRYIFHPGKMFCIQTMESSIPHLLVYAYYGPTTFTLSVCYFLVFRKIRAHRQNVQSNLSSSSAIKSLTFRDIKTTKILFISVLGFLACWIPIFIIDFVDLCRGVVTFPRQVYFLYLILGNLSAVFNPIIYGFLNNNFRAEYKKIILSLKKRNTDEEIQEPTRNRNRLKVFPSRKPL